MKNHETKVWIFLFSLCLPLLFLGLQAGGRVGLFIALSGCILFLYTAATWGAPTLLNRFVHQKLKGQDPWGVLPMIHRIASELRLEIPEVYILRHQQKTSFFELPFQKSARLAISEKLLQTLSTQDLEVLLRLHFNLYSFKKSWPLTVTQIFIHILYSFATFLDQFWFPNFFLKEKQSPFLHLFSPFCWLLYKIFNRDEHFYQADLMTSKQTGDVEYTASFIWKTEITAQNHPVLIPPGFSTAFIVEPQSGAVKNRFMIHHPALFQRMNKLVGHRWV